MVATSVNQMVAQQAERDFSSLDSGLVLQKLFDATKIDGNIAEWKPNYAERMYLTVSANGFSYTRIDTIIRFKVKTDLAVMVFHTYASKEQAACDTCPKNIGIAIFEKKPDSKWTMRAFNKSTNKYMQPGNIYNYRLIQVHSLDIYVLAFNVEYGPNQVYFRDLNLYNVYNPDYTEINLALNTTIYYSNKENSNKNMNYSYTSDVKFIPGSSWHEIEITTKGMMPDFNGTRLSPYNSKSRYSFDQSVMAYASK